MAGLVIAKLANAATKYSGKLGALADGLPAVGKTTMNLAEFKEASKVLGGPVGDIFKGASKIGEKLAGDGAIFTFASKKSKLHKGGKMLGLVIQDGTGKEVAKAAALIDPSVGKTPALTVKARSGKKGVFDFMFNPNGNFGKTKISTEIDAGISTIDAKIGTVAKLKAQEANAETIEAAEKLLKGSGLPGASLVDTLGLKYLGEQRQKGFIHAFKKLFGAEAPKPDVDVEKLFQQAVSQDLKGIIPDIQAAKLVKSEISSEVKNAISEFFAKHPDAKIQLQDLAVRHPLDYKKIIRS